ncbi:MAG: prepilin peptidase [Lentisphaeria bacterium]
MLSAEELKAAFPLFTAFVFVFGACVGSFLNVVVCRLPHGESLLSPPSHCPECNARIRAADNIPVISWLLLRGRCRYCGKKISIRYPLVEFGVGLLFLAVWFRVNSLGVSYTALPGWFFLAGSLVAVAITDVEHWLIPNKITYAGMTAAILLAAMLPAGRILWGVSEGGGIVAVTAQNGLTAALLPQLAAYPRLIAVVDAVLSLSIAWFILAIVRQIGRLLWGRRTFCADADSTFPVDLHDGTLTVDGKDWVVPGMLLSRPSRRIKARATDVSIRLSSGELVRPVMEKEDAEHGNLQIGTSFIRAGDKRFDLKSVNAMHAGVKRLQIPREVLGSGDMKLFAMIAAFTGMMAAFFTLMLSSVIGFVAGLMFQLLKNKRNDWAIPYGPYLAVGCILWLFSGPDIWFFLEKIVFSLTELLAFTERTSKILSVWY